MSVRPRVVCCGMTVLDRIMRVEAFHDGGGKLYSTCFEEVGGGCAATAACAIARLGGDAHLVARLGEDATATVILDELRGYGVNVDLAATLEGAQSPTSNVNVDASGERQITHFRGARLDVSPDWVQPADLAGAACVLVDMGWWLGAGRIVEMARAAGIPSVLDADVAADPRSPALLALVDHAVFSRKGLANLSGSADPRHGLQWARAHTRPSCVIGVTLGGEGSLWLDSGEVLHVPARPVKAVDTLGAGDVFHGAYALALAEGRDLAACAAFATAAAALKCTRPGGRRGAPTRAEVDSLLAA